MKNNEINFLCVTRKELFYAAVMLHLEQLVNIVYDFPANDVDFGRELDDSIKTLQRKKLLEESALNGISLDLALTACAAFCSEPESCEVIDSDGYYATIYSAGGVLMLLEKRSDDELAAAWFTEKIALDQYINRKLAKKGNDK